MVRLAEGLGLGRVGKNGLLLCASAGCRLILAGVVTTAELPARRSEAAPFDCPAECTACVDACPVGALDGRGGVDRRACLKASMKSPLYLDLLRRGQFTPAEAATINHLTAVDDHSMYTCLACVAACPAGGPA